jgi:hypothetical protein
MNPGAFGTGGACSYKGPSCGGCWALKGPGGTANIQVTDCCAGYPGKPSCLNSKDPYCDWCAANDHQHFDLDWDSFTRVCGGEVDQGNCKISASKISCPGHALADEEDDSAVEYVDAAIGDLDAATTDPSTNADTTTASDAVPAWAVALLVIGSLVLVALFIIVVMLQRTVFGRQQHV